MAEPRYLLDSNVCIYLLDGTAPLLRDRVERQPWGAIATSAIAVAEVLVGAVRKGALPEALRFFDAFAPLPFDLAAARAYGALPFKRGSFDRLIAAHALSLGLTLVTNNEDDFGDMAGLHIENWLR